MALQCVHGVLAHPRWRPALWLTNSKALFWLQSLLKSKPVSNVKRRAGIPEWRTARLNSESGAQHNSQKHPADSESFSVVPPLSLSAVSAESFSAVSAESWERPDAGESAEEVEVEAPGEVGREGAEETSASKSSEDVRAGLAELPSAPEVDPAWLDPSSDGSGPDRVPGSSLSSPEVDPAWLVPSSEVSDGDMAPERLRGK